MRLSKLFTLYILLLSLALLTGCSHNGDFFKIEGRFMNFNQGELYLYSLDGELSRLDTIRVRDGRFAYETFISNPTTFSLIFPNFSEQPIFGIPGSKAKIKADATHLKEMEVSGNEDNELMTDFRQHIASMSPPEVIKYLKEFVGHNLQSPVSLYLISKYLIKTSTPDYALADKLLKQMVDAGKDEKERNSLLVNRAKKLKNQIANLAHNNVSIGSANAKAKVKVIYVWSSWNYDSQNMQRGFIHLKEKYGDEIALLGISIDADKKVAKQTLKRENIDWESICDEKMWDSPLLKKYGMGQVPDNILLDKKGKIVARNLEYDNMQKEVEKLLGKK